MKIPKPPELPWKYDPASDTKFMDIRGIRVLAEWVGGSWLVYGEVGWKRRARGDVERDRVAREVAAAIYAHKHPLRAKLLALWGVIARWFAFVFGGTKFGFIHPFLTVEDLKQLHRRRKRLRRIRQRREKARRR